MLSARSIDPFGPPRWPGWPGGKGISHWSAADESRHQPPGIDLEQILDNPDAALIVERCRQTIAEMAELAGGLAHELRNPLSTIMINLRLLAEDLQDGRPDPEDVRRRALLKVETLRREAERLQNLFDEFLALASPPRLQNRLVDLNGVVKHLVEFFEPLAHSKGIEIQVHVDKSPLTCSADERLLSQALLNIAVNAQEAMPDGGILRIELAHDGKIATVSVSDTGVGISGDDGQRIFQPFYSTKAGGTGLGLSITRRIIREHGGELSFESELGRGSTFRISLPLVDARPGPAESTG